MRVATIVPPTAAINGKADCFKEDSSPINTSRLISSPDQEKENGHQAVVDPLKAGFR
jgi:hypothetical protein